jgi:hypothetical protein
MAQGTNIQNPAYYVLKYIVLLLQITALVAKTAVIIQLP